MSGQVVTRRRRHTFAGFDHVGYAVVATCSCGWVSGMERDEGRALMAFSAHRVGGWLPTGRRRP